MSEILWVTDPHFNFVPQYQREQFIHEIAARKPDAVLLGGDIAESHNFADHLRTMSERIRRPLYFVLGNHDYYHGTIATVRETAQALTQQAGDVHWLPACDPVVLSDGTVLIGHGGWGDARSGDFRNSNVLLQDYIHIQDLRSAELEHTLLHRSLPDTKLLLNAWLQQRLHELGDEAADSLRAGLQTALTLGDSMLVLMHVPPFREACWHAGRISDDDWAPHFVCEAAGNALRELMREHPDKQMTVLCGHTHGAGRAQILPNLRVITGAAVYGSPGIQPDWRLK